MRGRAWRALLSAAYSSGSKILEFSMCRKRLEQALKQLLMPHRNACLDAHNGYYMRMKRRKNLCLSPKAIARGEQLAAEKSTSLSQVIEQQLLSVPVGDAGAEEYWSGPALKP